MVDRLDTQVVKDGGSNEKMLDYLRNKTTVLDKQVQDLAYDQKTNFAFKKQ